MIDTLIKGLSEQANWRREKAAEYPDDKRNEEAAAILERLVEELTKLKGSPTEAELVRVDSLLSVALKGQDEVVSQYDEYHRTIGFSVFPKSAQEYLEDLIKIYREAIPKAVMKDLPPTSAAHH